MIASDDIHNGSNQSLKYTHVIFDVDGLLLNTEQIYSEMMKRIAAEYGGTYSWDIQAQMLGKPGKQGAPIAVDLMKLSITPDEYLAALQRHKAVLHPTAKLLHGADKLVRHLHKHNVPIAVATSSYTIDYERKATNHKEFFNLFPIVIVGDNPDIKHGKPSPDIFLLAASKFPDNPKCENVLVFEDSPAGVLAAKAAGMGVILVPDERLDKQMYHDPTQVIKSLEEFQLERYGFPPYEASC